MKNKKIRLLMLISIITVFSLLAKREIVDIFIHMCYNERKKVKECERRIKMFSENSSTELKEIYVSDIKKEVSAFANTEGGNIYIGVDDSGNVKGLDSPDSVMVQAANALKDGIKPDVMSFVKISEMTAEEKKIVKIEVTPGTNKPYYLAEKGLKPSGVYVRKGSSSQPVSDDAIREMIIQTSGTSYEKSRSINQNLTFETFTEQMKECSLDIGEAQFRTLHLIGEDGLYTNLALLLSDQCEHSIKLAVFQGTIKAVFRDRKEFTGSVLKQLDEVFKSVDAYNKTKSVINGLRRADKRDYDVELIREALLNCIVHRDYSFSSSTLINIFDDRIEFVSLGGLVKGISMEAVFMGVSQSRNPNLAGVFYRMKYIESYGTGIAKICRAYDGCRRKPVFEAAEGVFRLTLPNMNENNEREESYKTADEKVLDYISANGSISRSEAEKVTGLKTTASHNLLKKMYSEDRLIVIGKGKTTKYLKK